jgi:peptidoglycan/LPS O-acetylase OafA/YrhL
VFSHTADLLLPRSSAVWLFPWTGGVDAFFVVSGFIMAHQTQGKFGQPGEARNFLVRRLIRIVPPYWFITLLLAVIIMASGGRIRNSVPNLDVLVTSLAFFPWPRLDGKIIPLLAQGWSLNYEMFFYLSFSLAMLFQRGKAIVAAIFLFMAAIHMLVPENWVAIHFWSRPIIVEFIFGMVLAEIHASGWRMRWPHVLACLIAASCIFQYRPDVASADYRSLLRLGIPAMMVASTFIMTRNPLALNGLHRAVLFGGNASYAIYLSHTLTMAAFVMVWQRLAINEPWLGVAGALALSLGFAGAFHVWFEVPLTRWLKRRLTFTSR